MDFAQANLHDGSQPWGAILASQMGLGSYLLALLKRAQVTWDNFYEDRYITDHTADYHSPIPSTAGMAPQTRPYAFASSDRDTDTPSQPAVTSTVYKMSGFVAVDVHTY
ncbi:hypothetical protein NUW54_g280 [Trametes sanguinea]|uniref:Uncharacterized protein n=1 Tax=Trametes sanguinea TaxID=158606 RepID=A0ACC1QCT1_9APHY|nr:hypothetical protein NUW54_g280 [Trametes sanguinea]